MATPCPQCGHRNRDGALICSHCSARLGAEPTAGTSFGALDDVLTDDRNKAPDDLLIESDDLERIFQHLGHLDDREATVVRMRFGLDPYVPMTLREVGENLGLTRERVRQLESQALMKLMTSLCPADARIGN